MAGCTKTSYSIQSVDNALRLLELLSEENGDVRLTHLSEKIPGLQRGRNDPIPGLCEIAGREGAE